MRNVMTAALIVVSASAGASAKPLSVTECVAQAVTESGKTAEAEGKVHEWQARLAEVESLYYPKLSSMAYVAPTYSARGDVFEAETHWRKPSDWGPYTHLQALLAQPLYSFGRIEAGTQAAAARLAVERARVREVKNAIAVEVKKLYYLHLYALSMAPTLKSALDTVTTAIERAEELYDKSSGEVTQSDVMKLHYAKSELSKYALQAKVGAPLALAALKHTMGLSDATPLELAETLLPKLPDEPELELAEALRVAARERPEWTEIEQGKSAAEKLELAEKLANAPVVFVGGLLSWDWTPMRDRLNNPLLYQQYNQVTGGVALGVQWNVDPALAFAKADGAHALGEQVEALGKFASTGIALQVKKAHDEVMQARELVALSDDGVMATRKWMAFAASAYFTGTGEAKDLLEGLVSYLQARRGYYDNLQAYYMAEAELRAAMGRL